MALDAIGELMPDYANDIRLNLRTITGPSDLTAQQQWGGLRMNLLANPGVARADYEFWAFVVSAIHGCGACLDSHEEELRALGWSAPQIQVGLKIAAIVHAVATVLRAEGL